VDTRTVDHVLDSIDHAVSAAYEQFGDATAVHTSNDSMRWAPETQPAPEPVAEGGWVDIGDLGHTAGVLAGLPFESTGSRGDVGVNAWTGWTEMGCTTDAAWFARDDVGTMADASLHAQLSCADAERIMRSLRPPDYGQVLVMAGKALMVGGPIHGTLMDVGPEPPQLWNVAEPVPIRYASIVELPADTAPPYTTYSHRRVGSASGTYDVYLAPNLAGLAIEDGYSTLLANLVQDAAYRAGL
jgi:hypothetical protein